MSVGKISKSVFLDTSAFIPLLDNKNPLHARLRGHIDTTKALVSIDTIVLSEFLVILPNADERNKVTEELTRQFRIHSFDAQASLVCSELFKCLKDKGQIPKPRNGRQLTKVDLMIMSSAIVSGAGEFIFEDKDFSHYPKFLPECICGFSIPTFVRLSQIPPIIEQDVFPGFCNE